MDTQTGRFVDEEHAKPDMNRYSRGDIVTIDGDEFEVVGISNNAGRGRLVLKALSADDRASRLADLLQSPEAAGNRHERRKRAAQLRKARKSRAPTRDGA